MIRIELDARYKDPVVKLIDDKGKVLMNITAHNDDILVLTENQFISSDGRTNTTDVIGEIYGDILLERKTYL